MKIPRQRAIERLEERIASRSERQTKEQAKATEKFFKIIATRIDEHERTLKVLKRAAAKKTAADASKLILAAATSGDAPHLSKYEYQLDRKIQDHEAEAMRQAVELLKLSDDEYITVRQNSDLHTFLVG